MKEVVPLNTISVLMFPILQLYRNPNLGWITILIVERIARIKSSSPSAGDHHECHQCGRVYIWRNNLNRHLRMECGKTPSFQCPYCNYQATQKSNLFRHIKNRHCELLPFNEDPEVTLISFPVYVSIEEFGMIEDMLQNQVTMTRKRKHYCNNCYKSYFRSSHLHRHLRYECGKEPQFSCSFCPHKSKLKENLQRHIAAKHVVIDV
ncbi:zinc finger Y-chromosomal protein 2-like [Lycorma delicatula]|uniref:zinc finger Y-chromosomal protein 2-like n=1 Tax=Lycorma delicatula TaxID=130591 RepID=UPI003F51471C